MVDPIIELPGLPVAIMSPGERFKIQICGMYRHQNIYCSTILHDISVSARVRAGVMGPRVILSDNPRPEGPATIKILTREVLRSGFPPLRTAFIHDCIAHMERARPAGYDCHLYQSRRQVHTRNQTGHALGPVVIDPGGNYRQTSEDAREFWTTVRLHFMVGG